MKEITPNEATEINRAINKIHGRKSKKMNFSVAALIIVLTLGLVGYLGYTFPEAITVSPMVLALIAGLCLLVGGYLVYTKSYSTIVTVPICGVFYIASRGGSTHSIVAMSSMIIPLMIGSWISSQTIAKPILSLGSDNNNKVKALLTNTYESWKKGLLDRFSNQFKQIIEEKNSHDFVEDYYPFWNLFSWPLFKDQFNDTEFLIFLSKADSGTSYILTSQKLFYFNIADGQNVGIINLSDIKSYEYTGEQSKSGMKLNLIEETTTINNLYKEPISQYLDHLAKNRKP